MINERITHSLEEIQTDYDPGHTAEYCAKKLYALIKGKIIRTETEVQEVTNWMITNTNADQHAFAAHFVSICVNEQLSRK